MTKTIISIFIVFIPFFCLAQSTIDKNLSAVFIDRDLSKKPNDITEIYRQPFDDDPETTSQKRPSQMFIKNHNIFSGFFSGTLDVNYFYEKELFEQYGVYQLSLQLNFSSEEACIKEYNKAIQLFQRFGTIEIITVSRNERNLELIEGKSTLFKKNNFDELPRLSISYNWLELVPGKPVGMLRIVYYLSWNNSNTTGRALFQNR